MTEGDLAQEYRDTLAYLTANWSSLPPIKRLALQNHCNCMARAARYRDHKATTLIPGR